jgi:High-affinity nickel-transport protein
MTFGLLAFIGIGFLVGFRHAFEPDHLAAVSMFASRKRGVRSAAALGLAWGAGHTASVAAVAVVITLLGIRIPDAFYAVFELVVAAMLILIGVSTLIAEARRHRRVLGDAHAVAHHAHRAHVHPERIRNAGGAFGFGVAHGLAGSGAVIVLLVAAASTVQAQFAYLLAFGLGTVGGMCVVSLLVSGLAGLAVSRDTNWAMHIRLTAASASLVVGVMLGWSVVSGA